MSIYLKAIQISLIFGDMPKIPRPLAMKSREAAELRHGPCPDNLPELADKLERIFKRKRLTHFKAVNIEAATGCTEARAKALCYWLARDKVYAEYDKKLWSYYFIHKAAD
jgi:hypothetical protein